MKDWMQRRQNVVANLKRLRTGRVMIVGDVGLDEYVNGGVKRISPEAPVPVVDVLREEKRLGLAANVAQNISSLGGQPVLVGLIGQDEAGQQLRALLEQAGVSGEALYIDSERPTTRKLRVMSDHHHIVRIDYERKKFLSAEVEAQLLSQVEARMESVDVLVLQDYAKGVLSASLCQNLIALAKQRNKKVLVDPNRNTPVEFYRGADLMTPNLDEAIKLAGWDPEAYEPSEVSVEALGQALMTAIASSTMIITRSQDGMSLFENQQAQRVPTFARKVADVTGAGDTVIAAIALALAGGFSLEESCVLANYAAGVVVGKVGCVPCYTEELVDYIDSHS